MSTIELKLKSMGKLNEVLELLDQLNKDLENEQEEADTDYDNQNAVWSSSISDLETEISDLETQILYDEQRILDLKAELNTLNEQLIAYQEQKETFTNKRASLVEARENDISAYEKRVSDQTAIVDALQDILDLLQNENTAGNLAEIKNTVRTNLRKFKEKAGPYATLVGLTLTFDPEVISNIIAKLQKIQTSTQASIADDKAQEDKAEIDYQLFLDTIDGTLASIEENIINTQKSIATDTVDLNEKEEAFEAEKNLLESYNSQKTDLEKARDVYNAAYKKDTEERFK